jgi:hypothetical protein
VQTLPEVESPSFVTEAVPHVSDAVGAVNTGVAGHSMVALAPCPPIVGAVVSTLVMLCARVTLTLPQASTALQLRVVTKVQALPEVVSPRFCTETVPQVSDAVGGVNTGVAGHSMVWSAPAAPIVGAEVSNLVIL